MNLLSQVIKKKNQGLAAIAKAVREHKDNIIEANALDIEAAKQNGMSESLLDRLTLTSERIEGMAKRCGGSFSAERPNRYRIGRNGAKQRS